MTTRSSTLRSWQWRRILLLSQGLGTILTGDSGLGDLKHLVEESTLSAGCGLTILLELTCTLLGSLDAEMFAAWRKPKAPVRQAALVKATLLKWTARRDRLRVRGRDSSGRRRHCNGVTAGLGEPVPGGQGDHSVPGEAAWDWTHCAASSGPDRSGLQRRGWCSRPTAAQQQQQQSQRVRQQGAGAEEAAFAAGFAAAEKKQRRPGPYVPSSKRTPGQCMEHQFGSSGCTKDSCQYQHDPAQLGKYADTADSSGNKACMYFAVLGKCTDEGCERAHIRVPGARGNQKRCISV